jgi:hypothetical protein
MGVPLDGQVVRPGVITTQYIENLLVVDNCVFRGNNYGKSSVQVSAPFRISGGSRPVRINCATHMSSVLFISPPVGLSVRKPSSKLPILVLSTTISFVKPLSRCSTVNL